VCDLLTVTEVAQQLRLKEWAVRKAIRDGRLEAYRVCGRLRIPELALTEFVRAGRVRPQVTPQPPAARVAVTTSRPVPASGSFRARRRAMEGK
jgi:excisionase family DNA binding protein